MKKLLLLMSVPLMLAACHSGPSEAEKAADLAREKQRIIDSVKTAETRRHEALKREREENRVAGAETGAVPAEKKKKGWSNTAKGAVIGAGAGAITGAIVDKNNRGAGAVIGGLAGAGVGAATGAVIDHNKKKKEQKAAAGQ